MQTAGGTNGSDVAIALIVGLPALVTALAGAFVWLRSELRSIRKEVQSPNGTTTGVGVHRIEQRLNTIEVRQERLEGSQQRVADALREVRRVVEQVDARQEVLVDQQAEMRRDQQRHLVHDGLRFGALFRVGGIDDPVDGDV